MKRAALFHGTDGSPDSLWWPWLKAQLEKDGYSVYAPLLPQNHTPNKAVYREFLDHSGWEFKDNLLVGHSSGATTVLNLLLSESFPRVRTAVLVGTFLNEKLLTDVDWYEPGQFNNLFEDDYDPTRLRKKADSFIFVHGDDDPYCDIEDARKLCDALGGAFVTIKGGGHLAASSGITEIPEIIQALKSSTDIDH